MCLEIMNFPPMRASAGGFTQMERMTCHSTVKNGIFPDRKPYSCDRGILILIDLPGEIPL